MIGCAGILGIIGFVIGFVVCLFVGGPEPLLAGTLTGAIAFVAALLLFTRDRCRHRLLVKQIHRKLLNRPDVELVEFCKSFSEYDPGLLTDIRDAIATYFGVPPTKIHPTDRLQQDYRNDSLDPGFHTHVVFHVLEKRKGPGANFTFRKDLKDLAAFIGEVQNILNILQSSDYSQEVSEK